MSRIKLPLRQIYLILALLTCYFSATATDNNSIGTYTHDQIEQRLNDLNADVDLKLTPEVKNYLRQYIVSYRQSSETLIGRSLIYFPEIENKLSQKNLPTEIKYLSIVESALKPQARSNVGAVGLWQFMKATARMYGLKIDRHVDERKDVEKSTEAALEYLSDLNERFGDWTLALAAYNCGPGNVRKAMRRSGGHDYWSIRAFLPRETRNYVPKFIAITYLMNYYTDHELSPLFPEELFVKTRKVIVKEATSFTDISKVTGLDFETIRYYNPSYISAYIPKSAEGKILELPTETMYAYLEEIQGFEFLIPDPMQDLKEETKVAAQVLERRPLIVITPLVNPNSSLENIELIYTAEKMVISKSEPIQIEPQKLAKSRRTFSFLSGKTRKKEHQKQLVEDIKAAYKLE